MYDIVRIYYKCHCLQEGDFRAAADDDDGDDDDDDDNDDELGGLGWERGGSEDSGGGCEDWSTTNHAGADVWGCEEYDDVLIHVFFILLVLILFVFFLWVHCFW